MMCVTSLPLKQTAILPHTKKGNGFPYSLPSIGPRADPSVQAVSPQAISHPSGSRLPLGLLSIRPLVTFPATEHHRPLAVTKLYCLVTEAHRCEQLAQGCYTALPQVELNPRAVDRTRNALPVGSPCHLGTAPHY